jgi:hypothetical protein
MKKQIVSAIVLAGMIASSQAFASDARELVMGKGGAGAYSTDGGSFYYESAYNIFYNPAYINDFKNWAIFEKGNGNDGASAGFVTSMMNWNMGVFFNRNNEWNTLRTLGATTLANNSTDVMFGGDMGVKWGLGLKYGHGEGGGVKSKDLTVRVGAEVSGLDPFVRFKAIGKDEAAAGETKYKDIGFGARYHFGEWTPYAAYDMYKVQPAATGETKYNTLVVGVGRETKLTEGARLVYALYWMNAKTTTAGVETKSNTIPLDMAVEADAASWLTVRGGLAHQLNGAGLTTARLGGSFHLAKADLDYAFGNSAPGTAPGAPTADSENIGFDSGTFHKVSLRYSW